jgi:hypothetical protein
MQAKVVRSRTVIGPVIETSWHRTVHLPVTTVSPLGCAFTRDTTGTDRGQRVNQRIALDVDDCRCFNRPLGDIMVGNATQSRVVSILLVFSRDGTVFLPGSRCPVCSR